MNRDAVPVTVERFDVATREVSEVAVLEKPPTRDGFSVSPDGRWILYQTGESEYDIMLVENFR